MSKRAEKRRDAAEEFCRAFRWHVSKRVVDQTEEDQETMFLWLRRWMALAPKEDRYRAPKKIYPTGIRGS